MDVKEQKWSQFQNLKLLLHMLQIIEGSLQWISVSETGSHLDSQSFITPDD